MRLFHYCSITSSIPIGIFRNYVSPSSGEAYRDRWLTTNFELWVEIFCVPTCFHVRIPKPCLSVSPYPEKRNHPGFVNISPTLVIDTSMERSSRVLHHGNPKIWFFFSNKFEIEFWLVRLNMNLYDDIGDASSSLRGSTSSFIITCQGTNIHVVCTQTWLWQHDYNMCGHKRVGSSMYGHKRVVTEKIVLCFNTYRPLHNLNE